jgi:SAM-dependent methyltransferase
MRAPAPEGQPDWATLASAGFGRRSDAYERWRPGYPQAVVDLLVERAGLGEGRWVADLAAGTGKLTRQLMATGARCVAVEPSADMRRACRQVVDGALVAAGRAEAVPLASGSVDLVTAAQAFHWFDAEEALAEMDRVLRPGGLVALIWNNRDESVPWVAELGRIMLDAGQAPTGSAADLLEAMPASPLGPFEQHRFAHAVPVDRVGLVGLVASRSYVNVLPEAERRRFLVSVGDFAARLPQPLDFPYVTDVFTARRPDHGRAPERAGVQDGAVKEAP